MPPTRFVAALGAAALLAGCATTENALKDARTLLAEREAMKELPTANLSQYAQPLQRFGQMLDVYKDGDPVLYMQTRSILDATNLSNPLVGAEIPGDITEMVRTAVNRIGTRVVYVPYHPDYLLSQAQLGGKFGVTMPDFLITGALTEFDRALSGAGRSNNASVEFGKGRGETSIGADRKRTAIFSALGLDLNLVSFSTQQMVPRIQASNAVKVLNFSAEDNLSIGFYGDAFGFKTEGKYLQGRHSAIRTLVDLSVLELVGKATNTPYWRCIPNGTPDPVVTENMRGSFEALPPNVKIGLLQVTLRKYGQNVAVNQQFDDATREAARIVYSSRFQSLGPTVDPLSWAGFGPVFFGVPMPWDPPMAQAAVPVSVVVPEQTLAAANAAVLRQRLLVEQAAARPLVLERIQRRVGGVSRRAVTGEVGPAGAPARGSGTASLNAPGSAVRPVSLQTPPIMERPVDVAPQRRPPAGPVFAVPPRAAVLPGPLGPPADMRARP